MPSLTIRLDKDTDALLNQLSELLQQSKSTLVREGIARYLEEQLARHQTRLICRASSYMDDPRYRNMIYQGYTLIYKIGANQIVLLDIFKWQLGSKKTP